jgi:hypothetical protein
MTQDRHHIEKLLRFPLFEALLGRRSRRIAIGVSIPSGPLRYHADGSPQPLTPLETRLILYTMAGATGWHHLMEYSGNHPANIPNYATNAVGRMHPSAGGWFPSRLFFTDDRGVFMLNHDSKLGLSDLLSEPKTDNTEADGFATRLEAERLYLPERFIASHNQCMANARGSLLVLPVCDLAQVALELIGMQILSGNTIRDDIANKQIPDTAEEERLLKIKDAVPLSRLEQNALTLATAEMAISCHNGMLVLQAMGLGGWLYAGLNSAAVLGASGDAKVRGLGFHHQHDTNWQQPNCTGLPGRFEAHCPPHYANMATAFAALLQRKFGADGPFDGATPGPFRYTQPVRESAYRYTAVQRSLVIKIAEYIHRTYSKFPATVPTMYLQTVLQAHHLDLGFYDQHIPGGYLHTHKTHDNDWHNSRSAGRIDKNGV